MQTRTGWGLNQTGALLLVLDKSASPCACSLLGRRMLGTQRSYVTIGNMQTTQGFSLQHLLGSLWDSFISPNYQGNTAGSCSSENFKEWPSGAPDAFKRSSTWAQSDSMLQHVPYQHAWDDGLEAESLEMMRSAWDVFLGFIGRTRCMELRQQPACTKQNTNLHTRHTWQGPTLHATNDNQKTS